jgi:hypothetical protein
MKKITTILVIIILFSRIVTIAQQTPSQQILDVYRLDSSSIKSKMDKSATVIDGDVISTKDILQKTFVDKDNEESGNWYVLYLIKPNSVLKGDVDSSKKYEVLVQIGTYNRSQWGLIKTPIKYCGIGSGNYSFPIHGTYFLSSMINIPDYCTPFSNSTHVTYSWYINYDDPTNSKDEVLKFFDEKLNIKPILLGDALEKKSPNENGNALKKAIEEWKTKEGILENHNWIDTTFTPNEDEAETSDYYSNHELGHKALLKHVDTKLEGFINSAKHTNEEKNGRMKHTEDYGLTFAFANDYISGDTLEFDVEIMASDDSLFLDNCEMDLYFSNNVGNYLSSIAIIYPYPDFDDTVDWSYVLTPPTDTTSNIITVMYGSDPSMSVWHRAIIPTTFTNFLHFSIPEINCYEETWSSFQYVGITAMESYYTEGPDDPIGLAQPFSVTSYDGNIERTYCFYPPEITIFTDTIYPGDYYPGGPIAPEQLIIQGNHFGMTKGQVFMRDNDNGGATFLQLNVRDIQSWNDNTIVVMVPSIVDSTNASYEIPGIGSGDFYIKTAIGDSTFSVGSVYCPYSIHNEDYINFTTNPKMRVNLVNKNGSGSITFRLDTSITNYPDTMMIPCILKAIQEWDCAINVNFLLDTSPIIDTGFLTPGDTTSTIFLENSFPPRVLQATAVYPFICSNPTGDTLYYYARYIKIGILRNPTNALNSPLHSYSWQCEPDSTHSIDSFKFDFHGPILHELGHACLLEHVNQYNDLMYYSPPVIGPLAPWNRMKISEPNDIDGGDDVVTRSASIIYLPAGCHLISSLHPGTLFCQFEDNIKAINRNVSSIKIYPNPIDDNLLNVAFEIKQDAPVNFIILDNLGKEVLNFNKEENAGDHTEQLNLNHLAVGVYYLEVIINGIGDSGEIVKIR